MFRLGIRLDQRREGTLLGPAPACVRAVPIAHMSSLKSDDAASTGPSFAFPVRLDLLREAAWICSPNIAAAIRGVALNRFPFSPPLLFSPEQLFPKLSKYF